MLLNIEKDITKKKDIEKAIKKCNDKIPLNDDSITIFRKYMIVKI